MIEHIFIEHGGHCANGTWDMYIPHENSFNPCLVTRVSIAFNVAFFLFAIVQFFDLRNKQFHGSFSTKSVGFNQQLRLLSVLLQGLIFVVISAELAAQNGYNALNLVSLSYLITGLVVLFTYLPLHAIEVHKSIHQLASICLYWLVSIPFLAVATFQNNFTQHKLLSSKPLVHLNNLAFVNGVYILVSELLLWKRCFEFNLYIKSNEISVTNPEAFNIFDRISHRNLNAMLDKCFQNGELKIDYYPDQPLVATSAYSSNILAGNWKKEMQKKSPNLVIACVKSYWWTFFVGFVVEFAADSLSYIQPLILNRFISFFQSSDAKNGVVLDGFMSAFWMALVGFFTTLCMNKAITAQLLGFMRVRSALISLIYQKALRLSSKARDERNVGQVINLVSVDSQTIERAIKQFTSLVLCPIQVIMCLSSLYYLIGISALSGLPVIFAAMLFNYIIMGKTEAFYTKSMKNKDERNKAVTELLNAIKSIKLYSWEKPMSDNITHIRNDKELVSLKQIGIWEGMLEFVWRCVPYLVSTATFTGYVLFGKTKLTSELIFPCMNLFSYLATPLFELPNLVTELVECKVAFKRTRDFLLADELDDEFVKRFDAETTKGAVSVEIKNANFYRSSLEPTKYSDNEEHDEEAAVEGENSNNIALENVDITAKKGCLTCIVGGVGSGKTTLLRALLGMLPAAPANPDKEFGVIIKGNIAYCAQQSWVMNASIKDNILFGHKYDEEFFQKTLSACELTSDLEILPDKVDTQVGEKGISLSGGQKARVALARAVYSRADIYILDDILSAVDSHVSAKLIENVIGKNGLLRSKTLILSTNNIHVLQEADQIYTLQKGEIEESGTYDDLISAGKEFSKLIKEFGKSEDKSETEVKSNNTTEAAAAAAAAAEVTAAVEKSNNEDALEEAEEEEIDENALARVPSRATLRRASVATFDGRFSGDVSEKKDGNKTGQTKEDLRTDGIKFSVFKRYFKAAKYRNVILTGICIVFSGLFSLIANLWLKYWAETNEKSLNNHEDVNTKLFLGVYFAIGVVASFTVLVQTVSIFYFGATAAGKSVHKELLESVLRAPMSFFETTPIGRILNRFAEDIGRMDNELPFTASFFLAIALQCFYCIFLIVITLPPVIVLLVVLMYFYYQTEQYFVPTSRQTRRFVSIAKSPVFSLVSESLTGVESIKGYDKEARFKQMSDTNVDYSVKCTYGQVHLNRWLNFRLKLIGLLFLFFVSIFTVASYLVGRPVSAALAGLLVTFCLNVAGNLNMLTRLWVEVQNSAVSVERLFEYCDLKSEKPYEVEEYKPPVSWPMKGGIKFVDYETKYSEDGDPVLHDLNFEIKPQEKVGIVGRTGAGKSSLTLALFRIIEPTQGTILIDDVDVSKIGLFDLRSKLNIIPQDSQAFEGSVRSNLDPFHKYSDEEIWKALELAHLKEHVLTMKNSKKKKSDGDDNEDDSDSKPTDSSESEDAEVNIDPLKATEGSGIGLYATISDGGSNLSAGQKQLLCLARALLNPSKILVLDEATASVDVKTDKVVQQTIRKEFPDKTILTIAHRLDTIMDSDRVLVLDKGSVKEFDTPENLLKDKTSIFYGMCEAGNYLKE